MKSTSYKRASSVEKIEYNRKVSFGDDNLLEGSNVMAQRENLKYEMLSEINDTHSDISVIRKNSQQNDSATGNKPTLKEINEITSIKSLSNAMGIYLNNDIPKMNHPDDYYNPDEEDLECAYNENYYQKQSPSSQRYYYINNPNHHNENQEIVLKNNHNNCLPGCTNKDCDYSPIISKKSGRNSNFESPNNNLRTNQGREKFPEDDYEANIICNKPQVRFRTPLDYIPEVPGDATDSTFGDRTNRHQTNNDHEYLEEKDEVTGKLEEVAVMKKPLKTKLLEMKNVISARDTKGGKVDAKNVPAKFKR